MSACGTKRMCKPCRLMSALRRRTVHDADVTRCLLMTQSGRRYLVASHHIVGASTARMTIGIQMNHWHPLGIRHVGREGSETWPLLASLVRH